MKFHGRIAPGRIADLTKPLEILIHAPAKAAGVTVKVWEMDTYEQDGKTGSEGSADDLLATFEGDIEPAPVTGPRPPEWRAFKVKSSKIEEAEPDVVRVKIKFGGSETIYEVPIKSELDEVEGDSYELGFSMEVGGVEKFKTRSPALVIPATRPLKVVARYIQDASEDGVDKDTFYEEPLAHRHIAIGTRTTKDENAKFKILGIGCTDSNGYLFDRDPDAKGGEPPRPLIVRAGRELFLLDDILPIELSGVTEIPIGVCDQILGKDHELIVVRTDIPNEMSLGIAERPGTGEYEFGEDTVEAPKLPTIASLRFTFGGESKKAG